MVFPSWAWLRLMKVSQSGDSRITGVSNWHRRGKHSRLASRFTSRGVSHQAASELARSRTPR
jgi:hypothetical protein